MPTENLNNLQVQSWSGHTVEEVLIRKSTRKVSAEGEVTGKQTRNNNNIRISVKANSVVTTEAKRVNEEVLVVDDDEDFEALLDSDIEDGKIKK